MCLNLKRVLSINFINIGEMASSQNNGGNRLEQIEKEISKQIHYSESELDFDYEKFIENPNLNGILNTYYYDMPL